MARKLENVEITRIHVGDRLRQANALKVKAFASSMARIGLKLPIVVRHSGNQGKGKTPYILIDGLHRLAAADHLGWTAILAVTDDAGASRDKETEIHTNLIRSELSILERADAVLALRDLFEAEHGPIRRGGDQMTRKEMISIWLDAQRHVADELGVSDRTIRNWETLKEIVPELRAALYGTPIANQLGTLVKLAKLHPDAQSRVIAKIEETGDVEGAVTAFTSEEVAPEPEPARILRYMETYVPRLSEAACCKVLDLMSERHAGAIEAWFIKRGRIS